jgi:hypothetical protein
MTTARVLLSQARMSIHSRTASISRGPLPISMLQWTFLRGGNALACEIDTSNAGRSYDVRIVPRADLAAPVVEHFESCRSALCRHAEIAAQLRQAGWMLSAYTVTKHNAAA